MSERIFDYVVVGAGSAGCVLAARLSESGRHSVALLEAGPEDRNPWIHVPLGYGKHFTNAAINWLFETAPNPKHVDRVLPQPRGKVLGGSSSINGMVYIRGNREDYDHWRQLGNEGWSYDDVLPFFRKAEDQQRGADEFHGTGGPLAVQDPYGRHPLADAFVEAAAQAGFPRNDDFNGARQDGFGPIQWTMRNGRRCSAAVGYLKPARRRPNLTVVTGAMAHRLLFEGRRAIGVEYDAGGERRVVKARGEVIVAAGAIGSPQLLQLSGVGPADLLARFGIEVVADMPGVGDGLQDHFNGPLIYRVNRPFTANDLVNSPWRGFLAGVDYATRRAGLLAMGASFAGGFVRVDPAAASPDIQAQLMLFSSDKVGPVPHPFSGCTIVVALMRPQSRGHLRIVSPDPAAKPEIQPNYLSAPRDGEILIGGLRAIRRVAEAPAFRQFVEAEHEPGPDCTSDEDLLDYLRRRGRTSYHPACTCRMGQDPRAVVDARLRVRGFEGLRVADASIMPSLVSGNTNAPTIMIAEKASAMILADARAR